jgi:hypothetical protein
MNNLFIFLTMLSIVLFVASMIKPLKRKNGEPFKRRYVATGFGGLIILLLVLVGATDPQQSQTLQSNHAAAHSQNQQDSTHSKAVAQAQSASQSDTAISTQPKQPATPVLTGFGALLDDWNSNHTQDPNYAQNEVYDPTPGLGIDADHTDKYYAVVSMGGRVIDYQMRLPNDEKLVAAQAEVMQEFPSDASVLWQHVEGSCAQMEVQSATLGQVFGTPSLSYAFVEFNTDTAATESLISYYDGSNVNMATISQENYATAAEAPGC